ncbi:MAG: triose-phosphate isomerase [Methylomonas sp.]|nr:MAG: triose-phosphate isomerase [Methylomonas sp.]PPD24707.1 MAG: triose-phosphate isomerase [Methylomonas sp.]PPD33239.1 MAG: triose-phosphate isomerase [Methylomonas sp.]PPD41187.1 MAG: triose-phosphate isomerase [Methylomonas sp.]PPD54748.1 MAG: triose-phosphate isomerase [Methylomonas sp.]
MRQSLIMGNWKMNGSRQDGQALANTLAEGLGSVTQEVAVCVPFVYLSDIQQTLTGSAIVVGAQNVADQTSGAYTGEVSATMLADCGCKYALVGHSERRSYYGDTNASVAKRFIEAQKQNIIPVLCVGETLEERESNRTFQVVDEQLDAVIDAAGIDAFQKAVIAYEPVWAIGTGKTATDDQAQEVHRYIRQRIAARSQTVADSVQILYGGSVKPDNAKALFAMPDIDGGLVGGASLDAKGFLQICHSV